MPSCVITCASTGSHVKFELKIGTLSTAVIHAYVNGVDVTLAVPAIRTSSLVHHVQRITVQLTDASGINIIPYDSTTSSYRIVLECPPDKVSRAWCESNDNHYMTQQATIVTSQHGMNQPMFEFQNFWCSIKPSAPTSQKTVRVPLANICS
jgi:hypothetical protein